MKKPASLPEKPVTGFSSVTPHTRIGPGNKRLPFQPCMLASLLLFTVFSPASAAVIGNPSTPVIDNSHAVISADTGIEAGNDSDPHINVSVTNSGNLTINGNDQTGIAAISDGTGHVSVTNSGHITTTGQNATGMDIYGASGLTLENTGNIDSRYTGINASASSGDLSIANKGRIDSRDDGGNGIAGMNTGNAGGQNRVSITNSGDITTRGDNAYGIAASIARQTDGDNLVSLTNEGNVLTYGNGSHALLAGNSFGDLYVTNKGNLTVSGGSNASGIATETVTGNAFVANSGSIAVSGTTAHYGIRSLIQNSGDLTLVNSGSIKLEGENSHGIWARNEGSGDVRILQTGTLSVHGQDSDSQGIYAFAKNGNILFENSGNISASDTGGDTIYLYAESGKLTFLNSGTITARGVRNFGLTAYIRKNTSPSLLTNTGLIETHGIQSPAIYLYVHRTSQIVFVNRGDIRTFGDSDYSNSYGSAGFVLHSSNTAPVRVALFNSGSIVTGGKGSDGMNLLLHPENTVDIISTVPVQVTGKDSYPLYVNTSSPFTTGSVNLKTWALVPGLRQAEFGIDGGSLTFADTHLILYPGDTANGFVWDKVHPVKDMVDLAGRYDRGSTATGRIASVSSVMPMLSARLSLVDPAGDPALWSNQQVSLSLDPSRSYGQQANVASVRNMQNRMWLTNRTVASALANASVSPDDNSVFAQSYYLNAGSSGKVSSSSDSVGFVFGGTKRVHPDFLLGFHAGYEHTQMDADRAGLKGESDSWLLGLHARYSVSPAAFVRTQLTGSVSRSDYDFTMLGDASSDKRTEYAFFANVTGGYDFKVNDTNTITPEVGLAYLYMKNPSMDADWSQARNRYMDAHFDSESYHAAFATAALRWTGAFEQAGTSVKPTLALGVRQTLTDGEIDGGMRFIGNRYGSYVTDDKTVGTVEAGLQFTQKNMTMAVRYNGNFGSDTHDNVVWGEIGYAF